MVLLYLCRTPECNNPVGREGDYCDDCEKIREVENALDGLPQKQEIVPGFRV